MSYVSRVYITVVALFFAALPMFSIAQSLSPRNTDIVITASPEHPSPNQPVTLRVVSVSTDLSNANIAWSVNGVTASEGVGQTQFQQVMGSSGANTTISVKVDIDGTEVHASRSLSAQSVDLLYDAASYVPPFYKGRSLASPASVVRLEAVPHITVGGVEVSPEKLIYTWKQNGSVLGSLSGSGKSKAVVPPPPLFGFNTVSLEVRTIDGSQTASASMVIPALDPSVTLYQDDGLTGISYYRAIKDGDTIPEIETSLVAVPYFISTSPDDPGLEYLWHVNGIAVEGATSSSRTISVNAKGISGPTNFKLDVSSLRDYTLSAHGSWAIIFGSGSTVFDPSHAAQQSLPSVFNQ